MGTLNLKSGAAIAALAAVALWSNTASATSCVNTGDDAYMNLTTSGSATVTCFDAGDQPNPGTLPISETGPGTFNDDILNVPTGQITLGAKSDDPGTSGFFNIITGSLITGFGGTFTVDSSGNLALLFKSGGGNNTPSWWLYSIANLAPGEVITWEILGDAPVNGLSHVEAYVPIPAAVWLMASGLLGLLGISRRKRSTAEVVAA